MDWTTSDFVKVLVFLLPGFVSASIFDSFVSRPTRDRSEFERVVHALILTMPCQVVIAASRSALLWIGERWFVLWNWNRDAELAGSLIVATVVGMLLVWISDSDRVHAGLRRMGLTRQNSYPSEWSHAFLQEPSRYVVLHLNDGRRLFGWPGIFPLDPTNGHFRLDEPSWLLDGGDQTSLPFGSSVVISGSSVELVEFVEPSPAEPEVRIEDVNPN